MSQMMRNILMRRRRRCRRWCRATNGEARLVAFHPYVRYALKVGPEVNYRSARVSHYMENAPLGTVILSDSVLWENEGGPKPAEFRAWGYEIDSGAAAWIDAAIPGANEADPNHVQVHVWVKKARSGTSGTQK